MRISRAGIILFLLMLLAAFVFTLGITWGLPSRQDDQYLLGSDLHGLRLERFVSTVPEVDASRGADVVAPTGNPNEIVHLNDTDEKRAQILCRYRLYSYQPDEMITFRALSLMKPASLQFDPRLYQYGGLWIYPVGVLIKVCSWVGLVSITDRSTYIDNPELFGRFYVVARAYSAAWGVVGVWAVFAPLKRSCSGRILVPAFGSICFIFMPVVINSAHEAKPHLAGAVLILFALIVADTWGKRATIPWAVATGVLCGAASGMVLWGISSILIIAAVALARRDKWAVQLPGIALALFAMFGVYAITNPYVIYHLIHDPSVLKSNLGNTGAMYHYSVTGLWTALNLVAAGFGSIVVVVPLIAGCLIFAPFASSREKTQVPRPGRAWLPLAFVAGAIFIQFALAAEGKKGEYARFALVPDIALLIFASSAFARIRDGFAAVIMSLLILFSGSLTYLDGYMRDSSATKFNSRRIEAVKLSQVLDVKLRVYDRLRDKGKQVRDRPVLGVYNDPAPYCLPPVDLTDWDIVRLPKNYDTIKQDIADVIVYPIESDYSNEKDPTPISWANKQFNEIVEIIDIPTTQVVK
jgi:hypothetical protein